MSTGNFHIKYQAREDFNKARSKATISQLLNALTPERQKLLSLDDVRQLLRPRSEIYRGMRAVAIDNIVGSEGRYNDFTSAFLPKRDFIRGRWESVDRAHLADVNLPAIKLYEIGGVYFVRDGNHRVSVAKTQGIEAIDAEVVELDSEIKLRPGMSAAELKDEVIHYEKRKVFRETKLDTVIPPEEINFSEPGRYEEMIGHIQGHKYFLNQGIEEEIPFLDAAASWYNKVYKPIIHLIERERIIYGFPGRSMSDLYMWIVKHWDDLKQKHGNDFSLHQAVLDYSMKYGQSPRKKISNFFSKLRKALF
ncbi:MAG TPA: transcriptional regulator [Sediminispirochaeta sp.]|nr:transcriptional regulator [Sediminispirochaeta sp.]